jgi:quinol monooxygenase YgiN
MIAYLVRCQVRPGCEAAFEAASVENATASAREPGVLRFDLLREEEASRYVLVEIYRDGEGPKAHKESAHYAKWRDAVEPLLACPRTKETLSGVFVPERAVPSA